MELPKIFKGSPDLFISLISRESDWSREKLLDLFTVSLKNKVDKAAERAAFDILFPKNSEDDPNAIAAKVQEELGVNDPAKRLEWARFCAEKEPVETAKNMKSFDIQSENARFELALICLSAEEALNDVIDFMSNFEIQDQNKRFELAKFAAEKEPVYAAGGIKKFGIQSEDKRFEIARICAKGEPGSIISDIRSFKISNEGRRFELAKMCAEEEPAQTALGIRKFDIKTEDARFELAKLCAKREPGDTAIYIKNFEIQDKVKLLEILKRLAKKAPADFLKTLPSLKLEEGEIKSFALTALEHDPRVLFEIKRLFPDLQESSVAFPVLRGWEPFIQTASLFSHEANSDKLKAIEELCHQAMTFPIPYLREPLFRSVIAFIRSQKAYAIYENLPHSKLEKHASGKLLRSLASTFEDEDLAKTIINSSERAFSVFKDRKKFAILLDLLDKIHESDEIDFSEQKTLLKRIFSPNKAPKELMRELYAVSSILSFQEEALLKQPQSFITAAEKLFKEKVGISHIDNVFEKYNEIFAASRNPQALVVYAAKMKNLNDRRVMEALGHFVASVLDGTFQNSRYRLDNNRHLSHLFEAGKNAELFKKWQEGMSREILISRSKGIIEKLEETASKFTLIDTDDPLDLLLCGTEVVGSCQRVDGSANLTKGLLGYILDGKNRLIAVKDQNGRIVARSLLKLLCDGETPVLFLERLYANDTRVDYSQLIHSLAMQKAKSLGISLTTLNGDGEPYPRPLQSLGGPVPFEYSDASGGLESEGTYQIEGTFILSH